jgi:delta 1-pyrroline-5-carboxylate dehydrogenase
LNFILFLVFVGGFIASFVVAFGGLKLVFKGKFKQGFKSVGIGMGIFVVTLILTFLKIQLEQPTPEEQTKIEQKEKAEAEQQAKLDAEQKAKEAADAKAKAEQQAIEDAMIQDLMFVKQQYSGRADVHKDEENKIFVVAFNDEGYMTTIVKQAKVGNGVAAEMYNQEAEIAANVSQGINPDWKIRVVTGEYSMWKGYSYNIEVQAGKRTN